MIEHGSSMASTLARDLGQLLVGGFQGHEIDPLFQDLVTEGQVGGAILFSRNIEGPEQTRALIRQLQAIPQAEPLSLSVDQEGGRVQRLRAPFPEMPPMRHLGASGRKSLAHRTGTLLGTHLGRLGFHQNYAPVLDVDSNPDNPVIGDRAFSSDPHLVARLGAAFIDGLESAGIAACGKHFPGHGDTNKDSHLELPRLDHDLARLRNIELIPFRAAARVECASIMTAHILFPALDPEHPATLSEKILEPLLRTELGYKGIIVSDDLEMKAIADHYGVEDAAVRAIRAGCDQLLICHQPEWIQRAHRALVDAVESGTLSRARVSEAAARVRAFKERFVQGRFPSTDERLVETLADPEHTALVADLERAARPIDPNEEIVEFEFEGDPNDIPELDV